MTKVTVYRDTREQKPLPFPKKCSPIFPRYLKTYSTGTFSRTRKPKQLKIEVVDKKLEFGDYAIKDHIEVTGVEVKRSPSELHGNVRPNDISRFIDALDRFATNVQHPYLYLEFLPPEIWSPYPRGKASWDVLDSILCLASERGLGLVWGSKASTKVGTRTRLGELILRLMLTHIPGVKPPSCSKQPTPSRTRKAKRGS